MASCYDSIEILRIENENIGKLKINKKYFTYGNKIQLYCHLF